MKIQAMVFTLLVASVPCGAASPPWNEVIFADSMESMSSCPDTITVPDGTQRTRLIKSDIQYSVYQIVRPAMDVTEWDNVWGYNGLEPGNPVPWPGVSGSAPRLLNFSRWNYVGIHFKTPFIVPPGSAGRIVNPSAVGGPYTTLAISRQCGDFSQNLPTSGCIRRDVSHSDYTLAYYQFTQNNPDYACNLEPDTDYYINVIQSDTESHIQCGGDICPIAPWRGG
jgi:hypothetical protein